MKGCIGLRSRGCLLGYNPNNSLCSSFYSGIEEVVEEGVGVYLGPKDGMVVGSYPALDVQRVLMKIQSTCSEWVVS